MKEKGRSSEPDSYSSYCRASTPVKAAISATEYPVTLRISRIRVATSAILSLEFVDEISIFYNWFLITFPLIVLGSESLKTMILGYL